MMTAASPAPLADITNLRRSQSNIQAGCFQPSPIMSRSSMESTAGLSDAGLSPLSPMNASTSAFDMSVPHSPMFTAPSPVRSTVHRHDPYNWKCLPESDQQATMLLAQRASRFAATQRRKSSSVCLPTPHHEVPAAAETAAIAPVTSSASACRILVQFKCHHGEFSSLIALEKGQYVVVQGDRGMDIGVVIRVNTESQKTYIERTGPCGSVMRHATQREVDYWASELKADEKTALDFCKRRVASLDLVMEVRHAEYQFDKKKLTFYYDAKSRVDFVTLLKDLYREFGCRIWMEKVRATSE